MIKIRKEKRQSSKRKTKANKNQSECYEFIGDDDDIYDDEGD